MKAKHVLYILTVAAIATACSNSSEQRREEVKTDIPEGKEIKMEDVDDQLKADQERADSIKRELGLE